MSQILLQVGSQKNNFQQLKKLVGMPKNSKNANLDILETHTLNLKLG